MANNTGAPHQIPYLEPSDLPSIHGISSAIAAQTAKRLGYVGKSIIATSETRTASTYGVLATPDQVQNVVVEADGIIQIRYLAQWSLLAAATANAAIFISGTQVTSTRNNAVTDPSVATLSNTFSYRYLSACPNGLIGDNAGGGQGEPPTPVATGQIIGSVSTGGVDGGGSCDVFLPAGTYDVSIRFKTTASTLTVRNRRLWVRALAF